MKYFFSFIILLGSLFTAYSATSPVYAVDCPSIRINDIPAYLGGKEILSNTAPLEFGVYLRWENPVDNKVVRTHIYRKEKDKGFEKIGQVANTQNFYVDKTYSKAVPAYIYAVQSEFLCGGTLWSEPTVVSTTLRLYDTSTPSTQIVLPRPAGEGLGSTESGYLYIRDIESGVAEKLLQVQRGKTSIKMGQNLGTTQHALFKLPATGLSTTPQDIIVRSSNGAEKTSDRTVSLTLRQGTVNSSPTWKSPAVATTITPGKPLEVTWSLGSVPNPQLSNINISYSTNFGNDWFLTETPQTTTSHTFQDPEKVFKGLSNTALLWLKITYTDNSRKYNSDILPLFITTTTLSTTSPSNFVAKPVGDIQLFDAFKGTKITLPNDTVGIQKDTSRVRLAERFDLVLRPGFYAVHESMDNFLLDTSALTAGILQFAPGKQTISLPFKPYTFFTTERRSLSEEGQQILSNTLLPTEFIEAHKEFERQQNIKPVEPVVTTQPATPNTSLLLVAHWCNEQALCEKNEYTGTSPLSLLWDQSKHMFTGAAQGDNTSLLIPVFARALSLTTNKLTLHVPRSLMEAVDWLQDNQFLITESDEAVRWDFPARFIETLYASTGFLKLSSLIESGEFCTDVLLGRRDAAGSIVPIPTLCATDRVVGIILPFKQTEVLRMRTRRDTAVLQGTSWYVPYINQFQIWGMLRNQADLFRAGEDITRGELAYLLHKAFQYPVGAYQGGSTFADLPAEHEDAPYILGMVAYGIMSGDAENMTVRPKAPVNRAEALKMILTASRLTGTSLPQRLMTSPDLSYSDVLPQHWFASFVSSATRLRIVGGYMENGNRTFKPGTNVTRAEALKMIYAALEKKALE